MPEFEPPRVLTVGWPTPDRADGAGAVGFDQHDPQASTTGRGGTAGAGHHSRSRPHRPCSSGIVASTAGRRSAPATNGHGVPGAEPSSGMARLGKTVPDSPLPAHQR
jgi:hypothetical protein